MYMSNLFQTYFTFFFLSLFLDFLTTLVQLGYVVTGKIPQLFYYNLSKGKTGKTYRYKNYLQSRHAHIPFFLC